MRHFDRTRMFIVAALLLLLVSALTATPAFADEGPPPPATPPPTEQAEGGEAEVPPDETAAEPPPPTEEIPAETPVAEPPPTEDAAEPPAVEEPPVEPPPAQEPVEEAAPLETIDQLPDDTSVILLTDEGEAVLLDAEEVVEVMGTGDPIWCPASVGTPVSGGSGCTISYASLQSLVDYLATNQPAVDGVIWIEKGYDSSVDDPLITTFLLDGMSLTTMANFRLTIRGGWNGLGTNTIDTGDPSEFNAGLQILDWNNAVSISDIDVTGAPSGPYALEVTTAGSVTLTRVDVALNAAGGAYLDNSAGTADVTVAQSSFYDNSTGSGLVVFSRGAITLANVTASENGGYGVSLDNADALTARNVTLATGVLEFNNNAGIGLMISSRGAVTLRDITALGNGNTGAFINNTYGTGAVSLSGVNIFAENTGSGLYALSNGAITASNVVANANSGWGGYFYNAAAATPLAVTLTGSNQFKLNDVGGLFINSRGAITLSNIAASDTGGDGAYLVNTAGASSNVTLTGTNTFNENHGQGLFVMSNGAIAVSNATANGNGFGSPSGVGALLDNSSAATPKAVTLSGSNRFDGNYSGGLYVYSRGPVTLANVNANDSEDGDGAFLYNLVSGASSPQNVTLTGTNTFNGNYGDGLFVSSYGAIAIAALTASDNGWGGSGSGAYLVNNSGTLPRAITLSGTNTFDYNSGSGLEAYSLGAITVNNLLAHWNGSYGAHLYNAYPAAVGAVSVNGTSEFSNNGNTGLQVHSRGNITLKDLDSFENGGHGAFLNTTAGTAGNVSVGTSRANWCNGFSDNDLSGLEVYSSGTITLSNLCTYSNADLTDPSPYGFGAYVDNSGAATPKGVTLLGFVNSFDENYTGGLFVYSKGAIKGSNLSADGNIHGVGVVLDNSSSGTSAPQDVVLTGSNSFTENYYDGLSVSSFGAISLNNVDASGNGIAGVSGYGAFLDNDGGTSPKAVTLTGTNWFNENYTGGLWVSSRGAIRANNVGASGNLHSDGAYLNNTASGTSASQDAVLTGYNYFYDNYNDGLEVRSYGSITLSNVDAAGNGTSGSLGYGAYLDNDEGTSPKPVTLGGSNGFYGNYSGGLTVDSRGAIRVNNLSASFSVQGAGAYLDNTSSGPGSPQDVVLTGYGWLYDNYLGGLEVNTYGAISAANLDASENGWDGSSGAGVNLTNRFGDSTLPKNVTLTGSNGFYHNYGSGLWIESLGAIAVSNVWSDSNGGYGARLRNDFAGSVAGITVSGTAANGFAANGAYGLWASSYGAISASNLRVWSNGSIGAILDNSAAATPKPVTLGGTRHEVSWNGSSGLWVYSKGPITATSLTAVGNQSDGVVFNNIYSGSASPQNVTLNGTNIFSDNGSTGLDVYTYGTITLNNVTASGNGWGADNRYGVRLNNADGTLPRAITLNGTNTFNDNLWNGLVALSLGPIKVNNLRASGNGWDGAYLAVGGVTLTGTNVFADNGLYGLEAYSYGAITLNNVTATGNVDGGAYLYNNGGLATQKVTLTGTNVFTGNGNFVAHTGSGLYVDAWGQITISNLTTSDNAFEGAHFYSELGGLTLSGVNTFVGNYGDGLYFNVWTAVSLSKVTADNNGGDGVEGYSYGSTILISCGSMTSNGAYGWKLMSVGTTTLKGVFAFGNLINWLFSGPGSLVIYRSCP